MNSRYLKVPYFIKIQSFVRLSKKHSSDKNELKQIICFIFFIDCSSFVVVWFLGLILKRKRKKCINARCIKIIYR